MARETPLIIITGPTCSGKTSLALRLADNHPIEVISADSMQVYRYMNIATAKPTIKESSILTHHLIDVINPDEEFNAGMFVKMAGEKIEDIRARSKIPMIVGGTGLYIKALVYGLCEAPPGVERYRHIFHTLIDKKGLSHLYKALLKMDPDTAEKITPKDEPRIIRAMEILFLTGKRPSTIQKAHGFSTPLHGLRIACLLPDRDELYARINSRVIKMMEAGLIGETGDLIAMGYHSGLRSMKSLAYKHVAEFLSSRISMEEAIRLIQRDTRRYAKRQITWFKGQDDIHFFDGPNKAYSAINKWLTQDENSIRDI